jgi:hypothetical protein
VALQLPVRQPSHCVRAPPAPSAATLRPTRGRSGAAPTGRPSAADTCGAAGPSTALARDVAAESLDPIAGDKPLRAAEGHAA